MSTRYTAYRTLPADFLLDIPEHWEVVPFRHVFAESGEVNGAIPVGDMLSVSGPRGIVPKVYEFESQKRTDDMLETYRVVRPGQLAVNTMWLNYAGLGVSDYTGHVSPAYRVYSFVRDVDRRYVHHLLRSGIYVRGYTGHLRGIRPNSLQMDRDTLMSWPIVLPPLDEQRAIANYLDSEVGKVDELVAEQVALIEVLRERRSVLVTTAVTRGVARDVPIKPTGDDWMPAIPETWSVVPAKAIFSERSVRNLPDDVHLTPSQVLGVLPQSEYMERTGNSVVMNLEGKDNMKHVEPDDFIIHLRSFQGGLERSTYAGKVSAAYTVLTPNARALPDYYRWLLKSAAYVQELRTTTNQLRDGQAIRFADFAKVRLPLPPLVDQGIIARFLESEVSRIDDLIAEANAIVDVLKERKDALISAAVTGQIDVRGEVA